MILILKALVIVIVRGNAWCDEVGTAFSFDVSLLQSPLHGLRLHKHTSHFGERHGKHTHTLGEGLQESGGVDTERRIQGQLKQETSERLTLQQEEQGKKKVNARQPAGQTNERQMKMGIGDVCPSPDDSLPSRTGVVESPRVLVVVICSTRANGIVWESVKRYLLDELHADLALAVSSTGGGTEAPQNDLLREHAKYVWEYPDPPDNDYRHAYAEMAARCGLSFDLQLDPVACGMENSVSGGIGSVKGSGAILWFFRYLALQRIFALENNPYSHFIITRSDYNYTVPHPKRLLDDAIMMPAGEDYFGITDRHTVIPRQLLPRAIGMLQVMGTHFSPAWCDDTPEAFLSHWFAMQNLTTKRFPRVMYAVVGDDTKQKTSWNTGKGGPNEDLPQGVRIKYKSEFDDAVKTHQEWQSCQTHAVTLSEEFCAERFHFWSDERDQ
jgi:hypothetical protein